MKEVIDFLKKNPVQCFATVGLDGKPKVRPFQFMTEKDGKLWFCTNHTKNVFAELAANPYAEVCVSAPDFSWLRLSGKTVFSDNRDMKETIIETSPLVKKTYKSADNAIFEIFYLAEAIAVISDFSGNPPRKYTL